MSLLSLLRHMIGGPPAPMPPLTEQQKIDLTGREEWRIHDEIAAKIKLQLKEDPTMSATHDLVLRNAQATGKAPGLSVIETLPEGSLVKLWAVDGTNVHQGERFWARITHKDGRVWTGQTVSSLVFLKVAYGDRVRFNPINVYDYEYPDHPNPT